MSSNIAQFLKKTNAEIKKLQEKQVKEAKDIVLFAYSEIVDRSPVDTGLFRHNHFVTNNAKTNKTKDNSDNTADNKAIIERAKMMHNDTITIQNNLVYADALEAGHSKQAQENIPHAIYGLTEEIVRKKLAKRIVIK